MHTSGLLSIEVYSTALTYIVVSTAHEKESEENGNEQENFFLYKMILYEEESFFSPNCNEKTLSTTSLQDVRILAVLLLLLQTINCYDSRKLRSHFELEKAKEAKRTKHKTDTFKRILT